MNNIKSENQTEIQSALLKFGSEMGFTAVDNRRTNPSCVILAISCIIDSVACLTHRHRWWVYTPRHTVRLLDVGGQEILRSNVNATGCNLSANVVNGIVFGAYALYQLGTGPILRVSPRVDLTATLPSNLAARTLIQASAFPAVQLV